MTKISLYKLLPSWLKQLYISDKMKHLNYKGGCDIFVLRCLKEELAWAVDKQFRFISNVILLKNKANYKPKTPLYVLLCGP